jgi:putative transposase
MSSLCELFGTSRQAYYQQRKYVYREAVKDEILYRLVLKARKFLPRGGGRQLLEVVKPQLTGELSIGRDAFFDFLRENDLLTRRKRGVRTTYSNHWMHKYTNLIKDIVPTHSHQIWVSDITYINTSEGFGFLSLITDLYSRKIIGWRLAPTLQAKYSLEALEMALAQVPKGITGIIHHSDRGVQYCCDDYVQKLKENQMLISMTENGDPRENAVAERVNGILKTEWLHLKTYKTRIDAEKEIKRVIWIYNNIRPHSSISRKTPAVAHTTKETLSRCWKNYYKRKPNIKEYEEILTL